MRGSVEQFQSSGDSDPVTLPGLAKSAHRRPAQPAIKGVYLISLPGA